MPRPIHPLVRVATAVGAVMLRAPVSAGVDGSTVSPESRETPAISLTVRQRKVSSCLGQPVGGTGVVHRDVGAQYRVRGHQDDRRPVIERMRGATSDVIIRARSRNCHNDVSPRGACRTMPMASMRAYMVIGPTDTNPRRRSSLARAADSADLGGISAKVLGCGVVSGLNDHTRSARSVASRSRRAASAGDATDYGDLGVGVAAQAGLAV